VIPVTANGRPPKDVTVQEMLDETGPARQQRVRDQPELKAELLLTLGQAYETLETCRTRASKLHLAGLALPDAGTRPGERRVRFMVHTGLGAHVA
jgi:hypothetical protein